MEYKLIAWLTFQRLTSGLKTKLVDGTQQLQRQKQPQVTLKFLGTNSSSLDLRNGRVHKNASTRRRAESQQTIAKHEVVIKQQVTDGSAITILNGSVKLEGSYYITTIVTPIIIN